MDVRCTVRSLLTTQKLVVHFGLLILTHFCHLRRIGMHLRSQELCVFCSANVGGGFNYERGKGENLCFFFREGHHLVSYEMLEWKREKNVAHVFLEAILCFVVDRARSPPPVITAKSP